MTDRRTFLGSAAAAAASLALGRPGTAQAAGAAPPITSLRVPAPELEEATIASLQAAMARGEATSRTIAEAYLARIAALDANGPALNSVIELNPEALQLADVLDRERKEGRLRGVLHGIPVLLKDNIDTGDRMQTTAGSLALVGAPAPRDAFVVERLRRAGALILGKTNLSEWANFRSTHSTSGWSGRGGQTRCPYVLDRNPCGSSSGSGAGIAASLAAVALGTETDGSVVCPASANGLVGLKPTLGLVSRAGIVPLAHSQDTAGPMARTVRDAAILLTAMTGIDSRDPATSAAAAYAARDYTTSLDPAALRGKRLGVVRSFFGFDPGVDRLMEASLAALREAGAVLVDPVVLPHAGEYDESEGVVLRYEFKADIAAYLATRTGPDVPGTLEALIAWNGAHAIEEMPWFAQELFDQSQAKGPLTDKAYRDALKRNHRLSRGEGIDAALGAHRLDALVAPTGGAAWMTDLVVGDHFTGGYSTASAVAGYPHITVPAGLVHGLPVGISFFAGAWAEPALLAMAYAFEQATLARRPPRYLEHAPITG
jgi:amidase